MTRYVCMVALVALLAGPTILAAPQAPGEPPVQPSSDGTLSLTLNDAVTLALTQNPALRVEQLRVAQARARIGIEQGEHDPLVSLGAVAARRQNIVASRFYPTGTYVESERAPSLRVESRLLSGARVTFGLNYGRLSSNSNTQTLSPQYSAGVSLGVTQPLLRDFGPGVMTTRIRVAAKGAEVALETLSQRIAELVLQVEEEYWTYAFLREDLESKRRSLAVARDFLTESENLVQAGRAAPVTVLQARAEVAAREGDVLLADSEARRFEDRLKNLLWLDLSTTDVIPVDAPERRLVGFEPAASLAAALERRPEIRGLQRELEQREIEFRYASNQTKPRLDLQLQYSASGLSGTPNPTCLDPTFFICEPVGRTVEDSIFGGQTRPTDALTTLFDTLDNWSVEVRLEIPVNNRVATGRKTEAELRTMETTVRLQSFRRQIEEELRNAFRETLAAQQRIEASREAIAAFEDQLQGMRVQLEAGLTSSYDVLRALDELDRARTTELRALMDFNIGLSRIRYAEASVLERYNIDLAAQTLAERFGQVSVSDRDPQ